MASPSLLFLCEATIAALLEHYHVTRPPVPIWEILRSPPPDLAGDVQLAAVLPFGEALWLRTSSGQGTVFVNPGLSEAQQRYAIAAALYLGLASSAGGVAMGFPAVPNEEVQSQKDCFARHLLMPEPLLPARWREMSVEALASFFVVPPHVVEARLLDIASHHFSSSQRPH